MVHSAAPAKHAVSVTLLHCGPPGPPSLLHAVSFAPARLGIPPILDIKQQTCSESKLTVAESSTRPAAVGSTTATALEATALEAYSILGAATLELQMPDLATKVTHLVLVRAVPLGVGGRAASMACRLHGAPRGQMP